MHTYIMSFYVLNYSSNFNTGHNVSMATKIRLTEYHAKACKYKSMKRKASKLCPTQMLCHDSAQPGWVAGQRMS